MTYPQGINFRATAGFVTDGATEQAEITTASTGDYPHTTAQGNTVGWESFGSGNTRDRSAAVDRRLAGVNFTTSTQNDFRFDLPAAGNYNIRAAFGDMSSVNPTLWTLLDGTSTIATLATGNNVAAGSFKDATDTVRTAAAWPSSNAAKAATFSTTICRFRSSAAGSANLIAHAYVEAASGGGATDTPVTPGAGALTIAGYAPSVAQSANRSVAPAAGGLSLTGYAPTISQPISVAPGAGSIALTGYAPQVQQSANSAVSPGTATLTLVGYAPSVSQSSITTVAPQPGALALTGFAPDVAQSANVSVAPGAGAISITGFAPTVVQAGSIVLTLGAASLSIVGYPPTVAQSGAGGGAPGYGKARRKYVVRKGDSLYSFSDPQAAKAFLHADDKPAPVKQYPAKKQAKAAPAPAPAPRREPDPVPEQRIDLAEVRALAAKQHAEAEYQRLLARQQYETLLTLLERLREEEEDDWLLMAAD